MRANGAMTAGSLDRQITIEKKQVTSESLYGTEVITWVPLLVGVRFPANVQDVMPSRSEAVKAGLASARSQTRIRIRYRNDIDSSMRIVLHGDADVIYQIIAGPAEIFGRKNFIEFMVERYTS